MRAGAVLTGLVVVALSACGGNTSEPSKEPSPSSSGKAPATAAPAADLACLSTRDRLAQLLMVGVKDADDARALVRDHHVGGIFVGSWTKKEMLTDGSLHDVVTAGPIPAAVSVDEEGGRVSRLKDLIGPSPSARELAATQAPEQVQALSQERGQKMKDLGITIDFAPDADVTDGDPDGAIGDRSYSGDPQKVAEYAEAAVRGYQASGVRAVVKHFPGHGHASGDSHTNGVVTPPLEQLKDNDLVPYRSLVTSGAAVMIGHMQVPGLTGDDPSSLSPAAVELLRKGTGYGAPAYDGVIFTDDLSSMAAITDRFPIEEAVLKSIKAGVDWALWVSTERVGSVLDRLESAYNAGELNGDAINASVRRVLAFKGVAACG
ncbi:glycoside hydrolase family 3 N-terminal domain-containing protein [Mycobacteroides chelonae]|jgi:beta-N-acetylhexosaminidase|uniref:beta-N-acetylhexosaminidase n=1 Tax=Mycobacteroides chelonae TaxID=1774 RepID=A0AB73N1L2_MYCCH|nr:glycoside hydrolase family 3 N-terminal domain-containing protein [Mycobacteroides chelonae]MBF9329526.1 glycoside hydrolase family 3 protein [Mycobacteroides chelonae]MBF9424007.1 glycoside hydrolase family 3 protein [Mycobacteroides chelonae]MBF9437611.1 glycoside hydrolase family 3 protein [Mycobacteroides chelonae]MBV6358908.1 glycoside hydrolase family 3 protein [Mycobacteroides chelonae]MEC4835475.1 glycoside hydrolase family 3 N-terminal domain-containing protein [Mycobacteroides che